jgi:membrane protein implicated in regulation of membrane protease activity
MKKNGDSWIWKAMDTTITFRLIIVSLGLLLIFSFRWPLAFLGVLVLALVYCLYRIVKDRRASKSPNERTTKREFWRRKGRSEL